MSEIELLKKQLKMAQDCTLSLVLDLDDKFWKLTPSNVNTNVNWQAGHLTVSLYHNILVCMGGSREAIDNLIPVHELFSFYKVGTNPSDSLPVKPDKEELVKALRLVYRQAEVNLEALQESDLEKTLAVSHPDAKTGRDVLLWCIHHQMWHNGVIAMLNRILLGKRL